jgi:hypothetical protein
MIATLFADVTRLALPVVAFLACIALIYALMVWSLWKSR